ncbi:MAG: endolytic transglycosylase MltG [Candidatus Paceibacterota bacterium]|jgi:UPF0755 protein
MFDGNNIKDEPNKKRISIFVGILVIAVIFIYFGLFAAPQGSIESERFIVPLGEKAVVTSLKEAGFIKNIFGFSIALHGREVKEGAYKISKAMNAWQIAGVLTGEPYMKWVVIPEGLRKEETADILAATLGWSKEDKEKWITTYTMLQYDYTEGVYFPDTYLIPVAESPLDVANRLRAKFNEKFSPLAGEAAKQNIKWNTLLKIASIVQREAAGKDDMPLIAGILWNRLLQDIRLEVDATLQYARGDTGNGWWFPITIADKQKDSPYNTYKYKGLPPHPISNPGLNAISAVLYPQKTDCLFYLHDSSRIIYCVKTYKEHQANIEKYLR